MMAEVQRQEFEQLQRAMSDMLALISSLRGQNMELANRVALLEDDDVLPWPRPQTDSPAVLDTCIVRGQRLTITGTRARFIEFALDGSSAQWTATPTFPWPTDGSVGYYDTHDSYTTEFCWGS